MKRYLVCITGASGSLYGLRLLEVLARRDGVETHAVVSEWGRRVVARETGKGFEEWQVQWKGVRVHAPDDLFSPLASGGFRLDGTAIVPCSTGTLGHLAQGSVANLVHRAGAVALKERWPLVVVTRETPLSLIALENLVRLARAGAIVLPASPAFYNRPASVQSMVDFVVGKILDVLGIEHTLYEPWKGEQT